MAARILGRSIPSPRYPPVLSPSRCTKTIPSIRTSICNSPLPHPAALGSFYGLRPCRFPPCRLWSHAVILRPMDSEIPPLQNAAPPLPPQPPMSAPPILTPPPPPPRRGSPRPPSSG